RQFSSFLSFALFFFFHCPGDYRDLHSFPTRRSSDLASLGAINELSAPGVMSVHAVSVLSRVNFISLQRKSGTDDSLYPHSAKAADRKSTRLNSSHVKISYAVFCLKKKKKK